MIIPDTVVACAEIYSSLNAQEMAENWILTFEEIILLVEYEGPTRAMELIQHELPRSRIPKGGKLREIFITSVTLIENQNHFEWLCESFKEYLEMNFFDIVIDSLNIPKLRFLDDFLPTLPIVDAWPKTMFPLWGRDLITYKMEDGSSDVLEYLIALGREGILLPSIEKYFPHLISYTMTSDDDLLLIFYKYRYANTDLLLRILEHAENQGTLNDIENELVNCGWFTKDSHVPKRFKSRISDWGTDNPIAKVQDKLWKAKDVKFYKESDELVREDLGLLYLEHTAETHIARHIIKERLFETTPEVIKAVTRIALKHRSLLRHLNEVLKSDKTYILTIHNEILTCYGSIDELVNLLGSNVNLSLLYNRNIAPSVALLHECKRRGLNEETLKFGDWMLRKFLGVRQSERVEAFPEFVGPRTMEMFVAGGITFIPASWLINEEIIKKANHYYENNMDYYLHLIIEHSAITNLPEHIRQFLSRMVLPLTQRRSIFQILRSETSLYYKYDFAASCKCHSEESSLVAGKTLGIFFCQKCKPSTEEIEEAKCPVCLDDLISMRFVQPRTCPHAICSNCYTKLLACPMCRRDYEVNSLDDTAVAATTILKLYGITYC